MRPAALFAAIWIVSAGCNPLPDGGDPAGTAGAGAGGLSETGEGGGGEGGGGAVVEPCGGVRFAACDEDSPGWMWVRCVPDCIDPDTCEYNSAECVDGCFVCRDGWTDMFLCSWAKAPGEG